MDINQNERIIEMNNIKLKQLYNNEDQILKEECFESFEDKNGEIEYKQVYRQEYTYKEDCWERRFYDKDDVFKFGFRYSCDQQFCSKRDIDIYGKLINDY